MLDGYQKITRSDCLRILNNKTQVIDGLKNSKVVVIGGTGFVGTWIAEMISALNDEYNFNIELNLIARNTDKFTKKWLHLSSRKDIKLIKSDVRQLINFPKDAEWVIHAAANPDTRFHASNPLETASVISEGTINLMRLAERLGELKKILYLSSGLVSSNSSDIEQGHLKNDFANLPSDPAYIYANSKRFAESICNAAASQSRLSVVMTRPFSFIGPYQSLDNPWAQTTFISDALNGNEIRLYGDGQIIRSYLYGADAAFWFLNLLLNGSIEETINIGSPNEISLQNLAQLISTNFNPSPDIIYNTAPRAQKREPKLVPPMSQVLSKYNLAVYTPIEDAIKLTVDWHKCFLK